MKNGKIILGAAALVVTAASALAFKVNKVGQHRLYGRTVAGSVNCTKSTCFTRLNGASVRKCHTLAGVRTAFTGGAKTLWTSVTAVSGKKCSGATKKWTHTN